jgi:hypothetical protein
MTADATVTNNRAAAENAGVLPEGRIGQRQLLARHRDGAAMIGSLGDELGVDQRRHPFDRQRTAKFPDERVIGEGCIALRCTSRLIRVAPAATNTASPSPPVAVLLAKITVSSVRAPPVCTSTAPPSPVLAPTASAALDRSSRPSKSMLMIRLSFPPLMLRL